MYPSLRSKEGRLLSGPCKVCTGFEGRGHRDAHIHTSEEEKQACVHLHLKASQSRPWQGSPGYTKPWVGRVGRGNKGRLQFYTQPLYDCRMT